MPVAYLDSNVLIGAASRRDQDHERAFEIVRAIDAGELPTVRLTNYVIAEAMSYLNERRAPATAVDLYDRLKVGSAFEFVHASNATFYRAEELFRDVERLSFVDATLAAEMEATDVDYLYSFDEDFDGVGGITRLSTAENPFD